MALTGPEVAHRAQSVRVAGRDVLVYSAANADEVMDRAIERNEPAPYGAVVWSSAWALAYRLEGFAGPGPIVDVGAGCGLFSLAAAACGHEVIALDICPVSRALLRAAAADQGLVVDVREFDITGDAPLPPGQLYTFADVLYEQAMVGPVGRRIAEAVMNGTVWVAEPDRTFRALFDDDLRARGLATAPTRVAVPHGDDAGTVLVYTWERA